jgi:hypothetical protein
MFNKVSTINHRRVDFDTLLFLQARDLSLSQRDIYPVSLSDVVHPTQMIHQYTIHQGRPAKPWHCSALMMIPFFCYLSGKKDALGKSAVSVTAARSTIIDLFADGSQINFAWLTPSEVSWMLKLMVQVCVSLNLEPTRDLIRYGDAFYDKTAVPHEQRWRENFEPSLKRWISLAQQSPP